MDITYLQIVVNFAVILLDSILGIFVGGSLLAFVPENILTYVILGLSLAAWIAVFVLQGLGIYRMASNRGFKKKAMAFIPFVNIWYMGKLAGTCKFYGQEIKRAGLYTMLVQIVSSILSILQAAALLYLAIKFGASDVTVSGGFDGVVVSFFNISGYLLLILSVVYCFLMNILMSGVYKHYSPASYRALGLLTLICPPARGIIVFVMRNRKKIDYEAYIRARHEEYIRRQQQYYDQYGNPYGRPNPYGQNPYNTQPPYGQNSAQEPWHSEPKAPEDPFTEFGGKAENTEDKQAENGAGQTTSSDEFFD